ncbi:MAG: hypothetical protein R8K22_08355 [Mariprofundaceae bacterium]
MKHHTLIILPLIMVLALMGCQQAEEVKQSQPTASVENEISRASKLQEARGVAEIEQVVVAKESAKAEVFQAMVVEKVVKAPLQEKVVVLGKPVETNMQSIAEPVKAVVVDEVQSKSAHVLDPVVEKQEEVLGNAVKGAKLAKGKCGGCHYFDKARKKVGPSLQGIYGKIPTIDGVPFQTWDAVALDLWLTNPKAVKKNTKMSFRGISDENKRQNIIAFLRGL